MDVEPFYMTTLKAGLRLRKTRSPSYSLRAFARDLDLNPGTLSLVLRGKRRLSYQDSHKIAEKLNLDPIERSTFVESLCVPKQSLDQISVNYEERFILDGSYESVICEWEHFILLDLFDLDDFRNDVTYFAEKLGVDETRVQEVLKNLLRSGLLDYRDGAYVRIHDLIRTTEDVSSTALRRAQLSNLTLGAEKLDDVDLHRRDFSSISFPVAEDRLPEAKAIIREFRKKMEALFRSGQKTEVYQLCIQLYPMTTACSPEDS
jgi:uncharacterized protein (TIGR02147 family)